MKLSTEELQNEIYYKLSLDIIKKMLQKELITEQEFKEIDELNRESFRPKLRNVMP